MRKQQCRAAAVDISDMHSGDVKACLHPERNHHLQGRFDMRRAFLSGS